MLTYVIGFFLACITAMLIAIAIVCSLACYRTVLHIIDVVKKKEKLAFDFHLFTVICAVIMLIMIVIVWPIALYSLWDNNFVTNQI